MMLLDHTGTPFKAERREREVARARQFYRSRLQASYDAAQTTAENERHWSQSDSLGAVAANNPAIRQRLRDRSRYEVANDSYAAGIIQTKTVDVIGSTPRLSIISDNPKTSAEISRQFNRWANRINLGAKLRLMYRAYTTDGESFALRVSDPDAPPEEPQLDYVLYEADQVATPNFSMESSKYHDGVHLSSIGKPKAYDVLNYHPGESLNYDAKGLDYRTYKAGSRMLHLYRLERPGQVRGVPHLTPALSLFAKRRRFALATITAAEVAANLSAVLYTDHPSLTDADIDALGEEDYFDVPRGSMPVMPTGYKISQLKGEHPTDTYVEFSKAVIQELARCLGMPLAIASANSEDHNYSSVRFDDQRYRRLIDVERHWLSHRILDQVLKHWLEESLFLPGYLPAAAFADDLRFRWYFDPSPYVDPQKEAEGFAIMWDRGLALDEDYFLEVLGRDPSEAYESIARQQEARRKIEVPYPGFEQYMAAENAKVQAEASANRPPSTAPSGKNTNAQEKQVAAS